LLEELKAALGRLPRGKAPGDDGFPYEFYSELWPELGPRLCAVLNEAFHSPLDAPLPASMRTGRITLLYKGKGADRASPASYRPITLLNCDYKIVASVLAFRFAAPLSTVIDSPQTAFLPGRWIGDNILAHLEEIDYLTAAREPGVIVFLDLAKAFDRIDRAWLLRSLEALGMPAGARRWVQVMHGGTRATVAYNGWVTAPFPVDSGVFQGSPLSPLLYVAASQPLAAYTRLLARRGAFAAISLPSGSPAPILHQHADDTTIHVRSRADARLVIEGPVSLFCKASGSLIQPSKSQGIEVGALDGGVPFSGQCPLTGVTFVEGDTAIRHLGILLGRAPAAHAAEAYAAVLKRVEGRVRRYASHDLTFYGRAYVAKQVLASMFSHLSCFVTPPDDIQQRLTTVLCTYVASNRLASAAAIAGERGTGAGALYPRRETCSLPCSLGGINMVDTRLQTQALQARNMSRLLEPDTHAWKAYFAQWFGRSPAWLHAHPGVPGRALDAWSQGLAALFTKVPLEGLPMRVVGYIRAFRALQPHRVRTLADMPWEAVMLEPLFYNPCISPPRSSSPLGGGTWLPVAEAGLRRVGDMRGMHPTALPAGVTPVLWRHLLGALPEEWVQALDRPASPAEWQVLLTPPADATCAWRRTPAAPHVPGAAANATDAPAPVWQPFALVGTSGRLAPLAAPVLPTVPAAALPALVVMWDPARPWHVRKGGRPAVVPAGELPFLVGPWCSVPVDPSGWHIGESVCTELVVKTANLRMQGLRRLQPDCPMPLLAPLKPVIWGSGLRDLEAKWMDNLAGRGLAPRGLVARVPGNRGALAVEYDALWLRPSPARPPPRARGLAAVAPAAPAAPARQAARDMVDVLAPPPERPPAPPYARAWRDLCDSELDRRHRAVAWKLLHGSLFVGVFTAYIRHHDSVEQCQCPHPACLGAPQTLTHVFMECTHARAVLLWLARLWAAVTGEQAPEITAAVLLAADDRGWRLDDALRPLWLRLRLATLWHLWCAAQRCCLAGEASPTAAVLAARIVHDCCGALRRDWVRVREDVALGAGVPSDWLRGRPGTLTLAEFQARWCHRGILCRVEQGAARPTIRWSIYAPVPVEQDAVGVG
jgi:hypothetical protein